MEAINRACQLIEELDAGDVVGGVVDVYPDPVTKKRLPFEPAKYNALLGTNVSDEDMLSYFERLEVNMIKMLMSLLFQHLDRILTETRIWQRKLQDSSDMTISNNTSIRRGYNR